MSALPRGRCPRCFRLVALRKGDVTREHRAIDSEGKVKRVCPGSAQKSKAVPS